MPLPYCVVYRTRNIKQMKNFLQAGKASQLCIHKNEQCAKVEKNQCANQHYYLV
jgi:hypothetical protein